MEWQIIFLLIKMVDHVYLTQVSISIVLIGFCIAMIATDNTSDTRSVYLPILTSIVGVWLPQPKSSGSSGLSSKPPESLLP